MSNPLSGNVEISSAGPLSLTANSPVTLSAQITGAGSSFTFADFGGTLTVGSAPALLEQGTGTPPNNQMLSVGALAGVTTNNGNILLETTELEATTAGNLVLTAPVNAGMGMVGFASAGHDYARPGADHRFGVGNHVGRPRIIGGFRRSQ